MMDRREFIEGSAGAAAGLLVSAWAGNILGAAGEVTQLPGSRVAFDRRSLFIDGQRKFILSAAFHYYRSPDPEVWKERIHKLKALGVNAIETYFYWSYHSPAPGQYDFAGTRDADRFMDLVEEAGLYLIARPGPYICAEVDGGGLPGWLIAKRDLNLRCRTIGGEIAYDPEYMKYVKEWFAEITPRIVKRQNLILFQIENEYNTMALLPESLFKVVKVLQDVAGPGVVYQLGDSALVKAIRNAGIKRGMKSADYRSSCQYLKDLYALSRELGVKVPIFHNDAGSPTTRWVDVDIVGVDDYPITNMSDEWKKRDVFSAIDLMEEGLDAVGKPCPLFIPEIQGGWYDPWGGKGYELTRASLGPEAMDMTLKSALAQGAAAINIYMTVAGTNWGYLADPDVYTSYDYGAPISEGGAVTARGRALTHFTDFVSCHELDLLTSLPEPSLSSNRGRVFVKARKAESGNVFIFARNLSGAPKKIRLASGQEINLAQPDMQILVLDRQGQIVDKTGLDVDRAEPPRPTATLPALGAFSFSMYADPILPATDDRDWHEVPAGQALDLDALGLYFGFAWYRGHYTGKLESFKLDARHCWAAYLDGEPLAFYDNFGNKMGAIADLAKTVTGRVPEKLQGPGEHALVILVESFGHNKGFMPDFHLPRGIVSFNSGDVKVSFRVRGGLLPGESGITPVIPLEKLKALGGRPVSLPHQADMKPAGIGVYSTTFNLNLPTRTTPVGLRIAHAPEQANLYLNGALIGRYWESVGPQKFFFLMPPFINPQGENHLLIATWPWSAKVSLDPVTLEVYP